MDYKGARVNMDELNKFLQKAFDLVLNLELDYDNIVNTVNRSEALNAILQAQILVSKLNNKYKEMS